MSELRDFYSRDEDAPNYQSKRLEVDDALDDLIIKIDMILFTRKGEVMGTPDFGANLDDLIFGLTFNEEQIREVIGEQVQEYCLSGDDGFNVDTEVTFFETETRNGAFVDIFVNDQRVIGVLY
tara:strand:+ start:389 stop:757 length:369 start_codon:yes stop_codon:yes gene_type:complete